PVYQLLGGRSRDGVTVYGHANAATVDEVLGEVAYFVEQGYRAIRVQTGIPGMDTTYGVGKDRTFYEPADAAIPSEAVWSTERYLQHVPSVFARVRQEFGPDLKLLHDVHHRLTPIEAARLGKALEPYALTWLEDPVPAELQEGFRLIRSHTTTPLAVGEVFNTIWDCQQLITEQLIDYIRTTVVHAGGITHLRRIFDLAALYHVRSGSHGATDLSPVCMTAALHLDISIPNFGLQEYMRHTPATDAAFPHGYDSAVGHLHPSEAPGLGVAIAEALAARYPYRPAPLPLHLLADGTLHNWCPGFARHRACNRRGGPRHGAGSTAPGGRSGKRSGRTAVPRSGHYGLCLLQPGQPLHQLGLGPVLAEAERVAGVDQGQPGQQAGVDQVVVHEGVVLGGQHRCPHEHHEQGAGGGGDPDPDAGDQGDPD